MCTNTTQLSHQNHDLYVITQFNLVKWIIHVKNVQHKLDAMVGNVGVMV